MTIEVFGVTDKGLVREDNQDRLFCVTDSNEAALCVLADGMGGSDDGAYAASAVIGAAERFWSNRGKGDADLEAIFKESHTKIFSYQIESGKKCGTTGTVLYITDRVFRVIHAGDSRAYRLSGMFRKRLTRLTLDDTLVARAVATGEISRKEALNHPKRHVLVNCLGMRETYATSYAEGRVRKNDAFMLCSDGLHNDISDLEIEKILRREKSAGICAEKLLEAALKKGGKDNISVIAARVRG